VFITCKKCGYIDDEDFFPVGFSRVKNLKRIHHVCLACVQEEKDREKSPQRSKPKARAILYSHCQKYNRRYGTSYTPMGFASKFGWSLDQIVHDIEHAFSNWCSYCGSAYSKMSHGLADVTLDIINPDEPWYYSNTRFCCATCNKRKGELSPEKWGKFLASYKRRQEFLNSDYGTLGKPQFRMDLG